MGRPFSRLYWAAAFAVVLVLPALSVVGGTGALFGARAAAAADRSFEVLVDDDGDQSTPSVREFAGASRYETSLAAARRYLNTATAAGTPAAGTPSAGTPVTTAPVTTVPVTTVIVASGESLIDAAAAAGLARAVNAPVLLTPSSELFTPAAHLIERSGITRVIVVGGPAAISEQVVSALRGINGVASVVRLGGVNRFDTAALLALASASPAAAGTSPVDPGTAGTAAPLSPAATGTNPAATGTSPAATGTSPAAAGVLSPASPAAAQPSAASQAAQPAAGQYCSRDGRAAVLVAGDAESFADITIAGPLSYAMGLPILLTSTQGVPAETMTALNGLGVSHVVVVGGRYSIGDLNSLEAELRAAGVAKVTSLSASNQFATSVEVLEALERCLGAAFDASSVALVSDTALPDGISATPMLGRGLNGGGKTTPVLLVTADGLPTEAKKYLQSQVSPVALTTIGGVNAVGSEVVHSAIAAANADAEPVTDDDDDDRGGGSRGGGSGGSGGGGNSTNGGGNRGGNGGIGGNSGGTPPTTVPPPPPTQNQQLTVAGLPFGTQPVFSFGDSARVYDFTVNPPDATVTTPARSTNDLFAVSLTASTSGVAGEWTLVVTPPTTDSAIGTPYTDTVVITASATNGSTITSSITFIIRKSIILTNLPTTTPSAFDLGDPVRTFNFTVNPPDATVTTPARSTNDVFTAAVQPTTGGAAGEWTLSVTPPTTDSATGGPYTDTITITASASPAIYTSASSTLTFDIRPPPVVLNGLPAGHATVYSFGSGRGPLDITTNPTTAEIRLEVKTAPSLFTFSLDKIAPGQWELTVRARNGDSEEGGPYLSTVDFIASAEGHPEARHTIDFTVRKPVVVTGDILDSQYDDIDLGTARSFTLNVEPTSATVYVRPKSQKGLFSASAAPAANGIPGEWTLVLTSLGVEDSREYHIAPYIDLFQFSVNDPDRSPTSEAVYLRVVGPPVELVEQPEASELNLIYGDGPYTFDLKVNTANATVEVLSLYSLLNVSVTGSEETTGDKRVLTVEPPAVDTGDRYNEVYINTYQAQDVRRSRRPLSSYRLVFVLNPPPPIIFTDIPISSSEAFDIGGADQTFTFSATPVDATLTATAANAVVGTSLVENPDTPGEYTLTVTAPTTDSGTYTDTVTIEASAADHTTTTNTISFDINPEVVFIGLPTEPLTFSFGDEAYSIPFTVNPQLATVGVVSASNNGVFTSNSGVFTVTALNSSDGWSLSITPPSTDDGSGPYTDTATIFASAGGYTTTLATIDLIMNQSIPPPLEPLPPPPELATQPPPPLGSLP